MNPRVGMPRATPSLGPFVSPWAVTKEKFEAVNNLRAPVACHGVDIFAEGPSKRWNIWAIYVVKKELILKWQIQIQISSLPQAVEPVVNFYFSLDLILLMCNKLGVMILVLCYSKFWEKLYVYTYTFGTKNQQGFPGMNRDNYLRVC